MRYTLNVSPRYNFPIMVPIEPCEQSFISIIFQKQITKSHQIFFKSKIPVKCMKINAKIVDIGDPLNIIFIINDIDTYLIEVEFE